MKVLHLVFFNFWFVVLEVLVGNSVSQLDPSKNTQELTPNKNTEKLIPNNYTSQPNPNPNLNHIPFQIDPNHNSSNNNMSLSSSPIQMDGNSSFNFMNSLVGEVFVAKT
jgi:hypothetical protein